MEHARDQININVAFTWNVFSSGQILNFIVYSSMARYNVFIFRGVDLLDLVEAVKSYVSQTHA